MKDLPDFFNKFKQFKENGINRLNLRYKHIIQPFRQDIKGKKVVDIASFNGRWITAFSDAGASEIKGVEYRQQLVDEFHQLPESFRKNATLEQNDLYLFMQDLVREEYKTDIVSLFGIFYHVMDHYYLLKMCKKIGAKLIIIDSLFSLSNDTITEIKDETTDKRLHACPHYTGQKSAPVGITSIPSLKLMARSLGYSVEQIPWKESYKDKPVMDYYRPVPNGIFKGTQRFTFALRATE